MWHALGQDVELGHPLSLFVPLERDGPGKRWEKAFTPRQINNAAMYFK